MKKKQKKYDTTNDANTNDYYQRYKQRERELNPEDDDGMMMPTMMTPSMMESYCDVRQHYYIYLRLLLLFYRTNGINFSC